MWDAERHFMGGGVTVGAVASEEHGGRCRNAALATHDAQTGSTGRAKLINGILDPIAVGPTGIAMLASPFDGGELAHGELAESR